MSSTVLQDFKNKFGRTAIEIIMKRELRTDQSALCVDLQSEGFIKNWSCLDNNYQLTFSGEVMRNMIAKDENDGISVEEFTREYGLNAVSVILDVNQVGSLLYKRRLHEMNYLKLISDCIAANRQKYKLSESGKTLHDKIYRRLMNQ